MTIDKKLNEICQSLKLHPDVAIFQDRCNPLKKSAYIYGLVSAGMPVELYKYHLEKYEEWYKQVDIDIKQYCQHDNGKRYILGDMVSDEAE